LAETDQERTEAATPKRLREAREEGQVARSPEVVTVFVLGAGLLGLWVGASNLYGELGALLRYSLGQPPTSMGKDAVVSVAFSVSGALVRALLPVLLAGAIGGLAGNLVQVGFYVSWKAVTPNPDRINPVSGFQNLFQKAKLIDLVKTFLKVVVLGWAAYAAVKGQIGELPFLSDLTARSLLAYSLDLSFRILKNCLIAYLLIAAADYLFQKWQFDQKLKMTKEEVKEEYKETEGDPLIKGRIRNLQREMARRRMMAEVPRSDVVITNPTHLAIALRYDAEEMAAPVVTAKGADLVAERIRKVAEEHRVAVYQDPPVARALYGQVEIGEPIPADLFRAVAEILAHVYRLTGRTMPQGAVRKGRNRPAAGSPPTPQDPWSSRASSTVKNG